MSNQPQEVQPSDDIWHQYASVARLSDCFPDVAEWASHDLDRGDWRFLAVPGGDAGLKGWCVVRLWWTALGPDLRLRTGIIEDLRVFPKFQRQGIGTAIVRAALGLAWSAGCHSMRWGVGPENAAALGLYHSMGFAFTPKDEKDHSQDYVITVANPEYKRA